MKAAVEGAEERAGSTDMFLAVIEAAPDGIIIVDAGGRIELVNARVEEHFGYSRDELLGQPVEVLVPEAARKSHVTHRASYGADAHVRPMGTSLILYGRRKDSSLFPIDVSLSPLPGDGPLRIIALVRDITERAEAERRLASLAAIVEASDDAILGQDPQGIVTSWNRGAERLLGYQASDVLGRSARQVLGLDGTAWDEVFQRVVAGERVVHFDLELRRSDGTPIMVSVTESPIRERTGAVIGVSAIARDVTEQKLALETLSASAAQLRENEALAHIGSWTWDLASDVVQWSEEMHRITGREPSDFDGTHDAHLAGVHDDDRAIVAQKMQRSVERDELYQDEFRIMRPSGTERWVYAQATPLRDGAGNIIGLRGICQDVTERRTAEELVRSAYERERAAAEELREADCLKDEFLATVSHELRTPLTSIVGFAALLENDANTRPDLVGPIVRNADEMRRMVERLLDFTRVQAGRADFHAEPLDLRAEIDRILDGRNVLTANHSLHLDVPAITVLADHDGLDRIVLNLVGNAVKFAPSGTPITVSATVRDNWAVVTVRDRGRGVPVEERAKIFERFYQAADQPAGRRGTGVGLAIVRRYVELGRGRVWCDAAPGGGAVFSFTLPLLEPP